MKAISYLGLVPARGGSRSIPRKNLADVGGKPLVQRTIEAGLASQQVEMLLLSSDDQEILALAEPLGCVPVRRPAELATDESPTIDAALHALDHAERELGLWAEMLVLLQPTSPFRTAADIDAAVATFERSGRDSLVSVVPVEQHPCNCVRVVGGRLEHAVPLPRPNARRQDLPEYFYIDGATYVVRVDALRRSGAFIDERTVLHVQEQSHGLDINQEHELMVARALLAEATLD